MSAEDVWEAGVQLDLVLVKILVQLLCPKHLFANVLRKQEHRDYYFNTHLCNPDKLIIVVMAMEERLFPVLGEKWTQPSSKLISIFTWKSWRPTYIQDSTCQGCSRTSGSQPAALGPLGENDCFREILNKHRAPWSSATQPLRCTPGQGGKTQPDPSQSVAAYDLVYYWQKCVSKFTFCSHGRSWHCEAWRLCA